MRPTMNLSQDAGALRLPIPFHMRAATEKRGHTMTYSGNPIRYPRGFPDESFSLPTACCDSENRTIATAVRNILKGCAEDEAEVAKRLFYWVRDNIQYTLGLQADSASTTLQKNKGSCSNKANLLAALLRSVGIPAGFHLMEVKTKLYFGPLAVNRVSKFVSDKSLHAHNSIFLRGKWVSVDCSDDIRLSQSLRHLTVPATPVWFDGVRDALLHIDPSHIISKTSSPLASIDHVLAKKVRLPSEIVAFLNTYLDYLRRSCIVAASVEEAESNFFEWFREMHPAEYKAFLRHEAALAGHQPCILSQATQTEENHGVMDTQKT